MTLIIPYKEQAQGNGEYNVYGGIDPGKKGAVCLLEKYTDNKKGFDNVQFFDWDDADSFINLMRIHFIDTKGQSYVDFMILEKVSARPVSVGGKPLNRPKALFSFGQNFGCWQGILKSFQVSNQEMPPQQWQKELTTGIDGKDAKDRAKVAALRLFPELSDRLHGPRGGWKDGRADALLMAYKAFLVYNN